MQKGLTYVCEQYIRIVRVYCIVCFQYLPEFDQRGQPEYTCNCLVCDLFSNKMRRCRHYCRLFRILYSLMTGYPCSFLPPLLFFFRAFVPSCFSFPLPLHIRLQTYIFYIRETVLTHRGYTWSPHPPSIYRNTCDIYALLLATLAYINDLEETEIMYVRDLLSVDRQCHHRRIVRGSFLGGSHI